MRYSIHEFVDPILYRYDKNDAIQLAKNSMARKLAAKFIEVHAPAKPEHDIRTGELVMTFDMEIVSHFDAELLREKARQDAYELAREDIKRKIPYGMDPDEQEVV